MNIYQISLFNGGRYHYRFGGSQAEARLQKKELVELFDVSTKSVEITPIDVPYGKGPFIEWLTKYVEEVTSG